MFNFFKTQEKIKDPVCNMRVDKKKTKFSTAYKENIYYFCSENCKMTFDADKEMYA